MSDVIEKGLEEIFGGIPFYIEDNLKYLTVDTSNNGEFKCEPCGKIIQVVYGNSKLTARKFHAHLSSKFHKTVSFSTKDLLEALTQTFNGKIPQLVRRNVYVMDFQDYDYKCYICDKILKVKNSPSETETSFSYHFLSTNHIQQLEVYKFMKDLLTDIFGEIPDEIMSNIKFIRLTRSGKNYVCEICNVLLFTDDAIDFHDHFRSAEHSNNATIAKVVSLIPKMRISESRVSFYLKRNIEHITSSMGNLFCNLCDVAIKYDPVDIDVTEQNLKLHILSVNHQNNLFHGIDCDHDLTCNITRVFGEFSGLVLKNLKYIRQTDNDFSCSICKTELKNRKNVEQIKNIIVQHIKSPSHMKSVSKEMQRCNSLVKSLERIFLSDLPLMIKENVSFLVFEGGSDFQCTLCEATLQTTKTITDPEHTALITKENFERHLDTLQHSNAVQSTYDMSDIVESQLNELCYPIPQFIIKNLDNILYNNSNDNFNCILCNEEILVDIGNKSKEMTLQNFKRHVFSTSHSYNLQMKSKGMVEGIEKLETIFGGIPVCILSNVEYLYQQGKGSFFCTACDATIKLGSCLDTSIQNFSKHLFGNRHKSNVEMIEASVERAFQFLNNNFCLPEFLLKEFDFFENHNDDLYCNMCQDVVIVEYGDLKKTRWSLKNHVKSARHKLMLKYLS